MIRRTRVVFDRDLRRREAVFLELARDQIAARDVDLLLFACSRPAR